MKTNEQEKPSLEQADTALRQIAEVILAAKFTPRDLQGASEEKRTLFRELIAALRRWTLALDAEDGGQKHRAKGMVDLITARQMWIIRQLAAGLGIDPDRWAREIFQCDLIYLSRNAASRFITHLKLEGGSEEEE